VSIEPAPLRSWIALVALVCVCGPARAERDWSAFRSETGRFLVELPAAPEVHTESSITFFGAVRHTKYTLRVENALVAVEVHEFPAVAATLLPSHAILEHTRRGVLEDTHSRQIESHARTVQEMPALDFTYEMPGTPTRRERALAVLVDHRVYLVTGMTEGSPGSHPEIGRFFESFRFWQDGSTASAQPPREREARDLLP
jgi:hypothetical protein